MWVPKIINCTPHEVNVIAEDGSVTETYPPSGSVARIADKWEPYPGDTAGTKYHEWTQDIRVLRTDFSHVTGLPDQEAETFYIVSRITATALAFKRQDLLFPGIEVRDDEGRIIGCRFLAVSGLWA